MSQALYIRATARFLPFLTARRSSTTRRPPLLEVRRNTLDHQHSLPRVSVILSPRGGDNTFLGGIPAGDRMRLFEVFKSWDGCSQTCSERAWELYLGIAWALLVSANLPTFPRTICRPRFLARHVCTYYVVAAAAIRSWGGSITIDGDTTFLNNTSQYNGGETRCVPSHR